MYYFFISSPKIYKGIIILLTCLTYPNSVNIEISFDLFPHKKIVYRGSVLLEIEAKHLCNFFTFVKKSVVSTAHGLYTKNHLPKIVNKLNSFFINIIMDKSNIDQNGYIVQIPKYHFKVSKMGYVQIDKYLNWHLIFKEKKIK